MVVTIALEAVLEQMEQVIEEAGRQVMRDALWQGDLAATLTALDALRPAAPAESLPALDKTLSYLQGQRAWLGNYVAWQEAGYPVGSGSIEVRSLS